MPNSKFLTSEFMVLESKRERRRPWSRHGHQEPSSQQTDGVTRPDNAMQPDMATPLAPDMGYRGWSEEMERQRIMAASR